MSHLSNLLRAPFDLGVYAAAARQPLRRTFGFLFLLVLIATAAGTTSLTLRARDLWRRLEPHLDALPTVTIEHGEARANVPQPWVRSLGRDSEGYDVVVIIDTTGQRRDFKPGEMGAFLQRTQLLLKDHRQERAVSLDKVPDLTIGPDVARDFIRHWMRRLPFYLAAALLVWYLFTKLVHALLLTLAVLAGAGRRRLGFGALFAIATYALAPAVLLGAALPLLPVHVPWALALPGLAAIVYAVLGGRRAAASLPGDPLP